jgi:hypothetical protein
VDIKKALKKTGKAVRTKKPDYYAQMNDEGQLLWHDILYPDDTYFVQVSAILADNWVSYPIEKEIRPEKAGELWEHREEKISFFIFKKNPNTVDKNIMDETGITDDFENLSSEVIHNKNGWKRLFPVVEEEDIERIEVRHSGYRNGNEICFYYEPQHRGALDIAGAVILEIPKEDDT